MATRIGVRWEADEISNQLVHSVAELPDEYRTEHLRLAAIGLRLASTPLPQPHGTNSQDRVPRRLSRVAPSEAGSPSLPKDG